MPPPNILIIMSDQHSAAWSGAYGHPFLHTPAIDRLAAEGATFNNAYCNSPICAPSRASFMTGRLVSEIAAWDNGTPLGSDQPTWAHTLNAAGYETALCGKMHFIGPDQMHGFQRRLLSDVHGSHNPRLIANWDSLDISRAAMDRSAFDESGPGDSTYQQYDDAVANRTAAYLAEAARHERPWVLCASFITPYNPLIVRQQYWDQYFPDHADQPTIAPHKDTLHPHNRGGMGPEHKIRNFDLVWDGRYKLVVSKRDDGDMLFDLDRDPLENENIAADQPEIVTRLRAVLETELARSP